MNRLDEQVGKRLEFAMEQRHIDNGVYREPWRCAVALLVKEILGAARVDACIPNILVCMPDGKHYKAKTPRRVARFMRKFDDPTHPKEVDPIRFRLTFERW